MAGASCPPELVQAVIEKLGATGFSCLYGSTEVIIASLAGPTRTQEERINHVGTRPLGMELRIVKAGTMEEVPPGVEGELCVRGQSSMPRYYKMEEETQRLWMMVAGGIAAIWPKSMRLPLPHYRTHQGLDYSRR